MPTISNCFVGSAQQKAIYIGSTLCWSSGDDSYSLTVTSSQTWTCPVAGTYTFKLVSGRSQSGLGNCVEEYLEEWDEPYPMEGKCDDGAPGNATTASGAVSANSGTSPGGIGYSYYWSYVTADPAYWESYLFGGTSGTQVEKTVQVTLAAGATVNINIGTGYGANGRVEITR